MLARMTQERLSDGCLFVGLDADGDLDRDVAAFSRNRNSRSKPPTSAVSREAPVRSTLRRIRRGRGQAAAVRTYAGGRDSIGSRCANALARRTDPRDIKRMGKHRFMAKCERTLGGARRYIAQSERVVGRAADDREISWDAMRTPYAIPTTDSRLWRTTTAAVADLASLFGGIDFCACEHCGRCLGRRVLTDLLLFWTGLRKQRHRTGAALRPSAATSAASRSIATARTALVPYVDRPKSSRMPSAREPTGR